MAVFLLRKFRIPMSWSRLDSDQEQSFIAYTKLSLTN